MSSDIQEYFVIFDTNVLYHAYDKKQISLRSVLTRHLKIL